MQIDISQIVADKVAAMESEGTIKAIIEEHVENAVKDAIKGALGGWKLRDPIEKALAEQVPDIVKDIGLDSYNAFIAETVKKLAVNALREDAATVMTERVNEILCKRRDSIKLSEILDMWRSDMNDNDEDEKRDGNEDHDGFTCRVEERKSYSSSAFHYYNVYFDEEGDKEGNDPDDYDVLLKIRVWTAHDGEIQDVYIDGERLSKQFVGRTPSRFEAMLMNLYLNRTPVIMDLDKYDADDHYYETSEDY